MVVEDGDLLHILIVRCVFGAVFGIHNGFKREFHVVRCHVFAVVPPNTFADMERVGEGIFVVVPAFCEARHDLPVCIVRGEAVEQKRVDLAVLVHSGIDARVIRRAVHKRTFG